MLCKLEHISSIGEFAVIIAIHNVHHYKTDIMVSAINFVGGGGGQNIY